MVYVKQDWQEGELITADKLNYIENGIYETSDKSQFKKRNQTDISHWTTRYQTGQGATVINGYLYTFSGNSNNAGDVQDVLVKDLTRGYSPIGAYIDPVDLPKITHNVGHANSVDFINNTISLSYNSMSIDTGYLVVSNGNWNPTITLFENVNNKIAFFDYNNAVNLIFKEGTKTIEGWGGFCFGEDFKTLFYVRKTESNGTSVTVNKILLGTGNIDLSDKTPEKSDKQKWGTFITGKNGLQYNGTAQILSEHVVDISATSVDPQPQDLVFKNNKLYVGSGFSENHVIVYGVYDDDIILEDDLFPSRDFRYGGETESVAIFQGRLLSAGSGLTSAFAWEYPLSANERLPINNEDLLIKGNKTFEKPISGSLKTRPATFTDMSIVAKGMVTYSGLWYVNSQNILNTPDNNMSYYVVQVVPLNGEGNGYIQINTLGVSPFSYTAPVNGGNIVGWTRSSAMMNGNYGIRVTSSAVQKTSDGGNTWTNL